MAGDDAAAVDSTTTADAATAESGQAADAGDVTHDGATAEQTTDDTTPTEASSDDEDDDEESSEGQTEEEKSKSEKRRERRRAREAERIAEAVQAEVAKREAEGKTKAATEKAAADAKAAADNWRKEFGSFVGTPEDRAALAKEIDDLIAETLSVSTDPDSNDTTIEELRRINAAQKALVEKRAALQKFDANQDVYRRLDRFQFQQTQNEYARFGSDLPAEHQPTFFAAQTVTDALTALVAGLRAEGESKTKAEVAKVTAEWRGRYEREVADHAATRTGAAGAGQSPNSVNGSGGGGINSLEQFRALPPDQRRKLRSEQPAFVDGLYRQSA